MSTLHIYCDGACLPVNPGGVATWATTAKNPGDHVIVYADSQLVIYQLEGRYQVRAPALQQWWQCCTALAATLESVRYRWIPRDHNTDADALTQRAYQEHQLTTNPSQMEKTEL